MLGKVFGKKLWTKKKVKEETHLYDFTRHDSQLRYTDYFSVDEIIDRVSKKEKDAKPTITPKKLYKLGTLNQPKMAMNCELAYVEAEQGKLRKKLSLIRGDEGASRYGKLECKSMIERLGNRLRIDEFDEIVNKYPHTTTQALRSVIDGHSNLRMKEASEFVPDFPDDAVAAMEEYRQMCLALCGKDPVFYVIAEAKDFGEVQRRRDPILLAQSPFGFIWQILGAWDEEMIYLGDL